MAPLAGTSLPASPSKGGSCPPNTPASSQESTASIVSEILGLYLNTSASPSATSIRPPPPRRKTWTLDGKEFALASGHTHFLAGALDGADSDVEMKELTEPSSRSLRRYSTASSTSLTRQWLQDWVGRHVSGASGRGIEERLISRPLYRRARQQASSEGSSQTPRLRVALLDGPASQTPESPLTANPKIIGEKPDPETIERVIKGLEDVLQEAVFIAQQASSSSASRARESQVDSSPATFSNPLSNGEVQSSHTTNDTGMENAVSPLAETKKRSSEFSNFLNEYHRTLTWLSNETKPAVFPRAARTGSASKRTEQFAPPDESLVKQLQDDAYEAPKRPPARRAAAKSQHLSHETDSSISPFTSRTRNPTDSWADSHLPSSLPLTQELQVPDVISRDFATSSSPSIVPPPASGENTDVRAAIINAHRPANQRIRFSDLSFGPHGSFELKLPPIPSVKVTKVAASESSQPLLRQNTPTAKKSAPPKIQPRSSSYKFRSRKARKRTNSSRHRREITAEDVEDEGSGKDEFIIGSGIEEDASDGAESTFDDPEKGYGFKAGQGNLDGEPAAALWLPGTTERAGPAHRLSPKKGGSEKTAVQFKQDLKDFQRGLRRHHSLEGHGHFSLHRAHRRTTISRDWTAKKKRSTAAVACISTSLIGLIIGIYAGQVPAIQYAIVDEGTHYAVLGNVVFYLGLAVTTAVAWPLPLLYGRKKFTLSALGLFLALQFPQALVVMQQRVPYVATYRVGLLLPRAVSGLVIGFANMNFMAILLDLFGASLQSGNPHQEIVIEHDVRRHGGGMGVWLGIWTWCHIGSIGVGFLIGAVIIGFVNVSWGFWMVIFATVAVLMLNIASPETRIPAYRNSVAEVTDGKTVSRRVGRGEVMMHLYSEGPLHWWEEVRAGAVLCTRMVKQGGFAILALYQAWVYGQVVMVMILLAALASRYYVLLPQYVALCVAAFPLGALLAVPFQKASLFSRARHHGQRTDSMTFQKRVSWSTHLVRRALFMVSLPAAALAYTFSSAGPPTPLALPVTFAGVVGFLSNLALCECYGLIMETFDTSDLQPGMTGRPRREVSTEALRSRTNFSCFPRVTAGIAVVQAASFAVAAAATAIGGSVERRLGAEAATGVVAAALVVLTVLLIAALTRFRSVQVVPSRRVATAVLAGPGDDLPVVIGSPSGTTRRISLLELGALSRWTEIRRRNRLLGDAGVSGGRHNPPD